MRAATAFTAFVIAALAIAQTQTGNVPAVDGVAKPATSKPPSLRERVAMLEARVAALESPKPDPACERLGIYLAEQLIAADEAEQNAEWCRMMGTLLNAGCIPAERREAVTAQINARGCNE